MAVLNFGKKEKAVVKEFLERFPPLGLGNEYEEARCKIGESTVTLYTSGKVVIQGNDAEHVMKLFLEGLNLADSLVLGIDETGRGEDFGPFVIAGVLGQTNKLREMRDSKKTQDVAAKYDLVTKHSLANVAFSLNAEFVDRLRKDGHNLNEIEAKAIDALVGFFKALGETPRIVVDGSPLRTKEKGIEYLVKGDDLEPVVGAASLVAKHLRNASKDQAERKTWQKKAK